MDRSVEKVILESYKEQLVFNNSDDKIVMFSNGRAFEYNYKTHKVRPFTSVIWYSVKDEKFDYFIFYLEDRINPILRNKARLIQYSNKSKSIELDEMLKINLDKIAKEVVDAGNVETTVSFTKFFSFLANIYDSNKKNLYKSINDKQDF